MTAPRSLTLFALAATVQLIGCDKPTAHEAVEDARISARMNETATQQRVEMAEADRASTDERQKSWDDTQRKSDAAFARGISPVDR